MKKNILAVTLLLSSIVSYSQTFTGGGGTIADYPNTTVFNLTVAGLNPANIDTIFGLETVCINLTHTYDGDIDIQLKSPNGVIVDLSMGNGGNGQGYTNCCFNNTAGTSIVNAAAPFTGTFKPQGDLSMINNNTLGNGTWQLIFIDNGPQDVGNLISWTVTFGNNPAKPNLVFSSSNLPIVVITTNQGVPNDPKIKGRMGIIDNGPGVRNYLSNPFNAYNNKIAIETRGASSQNFPQKSYNFHTLMANDSLNDTIMLGMPAEHSWILYAPYTDKSQMRNVFTYESSREMGHYASRNRFCEVMVNGQYKGIYVFQERIKRDKNRVDIAKLDSDDNAGDSLTGGYIFKADWSAGDPGGGWVSQYNIWNGTSKSDFLYHDPSNIDMTVQQKAYIKAWVDSFENAMVAPTFGDSLLGYRKWIKTNSFIDYMILNEISKNLDGYRASTFFHKDKYSKGGKLEAGPAWDYNLGYWNGDFCGADDPTGLVYNATSCNGKLFWFERLMQDTAFKNQFKCRWTWLRTKTLDLDYVNYKIDSMATLLNEAQVRNFVQWPLLGVYTWPNPSPIPTTYQGEIENLKTWMHDRFMWIDANLPGTCYSVGLNEQMAVNNYELNIFPNPTQGDFTVKYKLVKKAIVKIDIVNALGMDVKSISFGEQSSGEHSTDINELQGLANGIYTIKLSMGSDVYYKKLVKSN